MFSIYSHMSGRNISTPRAESLSGWLAVPFKQHTWHLALQCHPHICWVCVNSTSCHGEQSSTDSRQRCKTSSCTQCQLTRAAEAEIGRPAGQGLRFLLCCEKAGVSDARSGLDNFFGSPMKIGENIPALFLQ